MSEYALIRLNMVEYATIYLKKQSAEYARILNVSHAVHSTRSLYKLIQRHIQDKLRQRHIQNNVKHLQKE